MTSRAYAISSPYQFTLTFSSCFLATFHNMSQRQLITCTSINVIKCHFIRGYKTISRKATGGKLLYFDLITRDRCVYAIGTSCFRLAVCLFIFLALFISMTWRVVRPVPQLGFWSHIFCELNTLLATQRLFISKISLVRKING